LSTRRWYIVKVNETATQKIKIVIIIIFATEEIIEVIVLLDFLLAWLLYVLLLNLRFNKCIDFLEQLFN